MFLLIIIYFWIYYRGELFITHPPAGTSLHTKRRCTTVLSNSPIIPFPKGDEHSVIKLLATPPLIKGVRDSKLYLGEFLLQDHP